MNRLIGTLEDCDIVREDDGSVSFTAGVEFDGDGANGQFSQPPCYAPDDFADQTLDRLQRRQAWQLVWRGERYRPQGRDVRGSGRGRSLLGGLRLGDFAASSRVGRHAPARSSRLRYVYAATVPYVVVPGLIISGMAGVVLGRRAVMTNTADGRSVEAVVVDSDPSDKVGEISLACARAIGLPVDDVAAHLANGGGTRSHAIRYQLFPGRRRPLTG